MSITVQATLLGYYGHRRRHPGEVFVIVERAPELEQKAFSKKWMRRVSDETPVHTPATTLISSREQEIARAEKAEAALAATKPLPPPVAPAAKTTAEPQVTTPKPPPEPPKAPTGGQEVI